MADGKLTDRAIRTLKERGRYGDGNTLYLVVTPGGSKQWVQRVAIGGKSTDLGLGGYPLVSLREAREKSQVNRKLARSGSDPRTAQRSVPTFADAAGKVIEFNRPTRRDTPEERREAENSGRRRRYQERVERGECPNEHNPAVPGHKYCQQCLDKKAEYTAKLATGRPRGRPKETPGTSTDGPGLGRVFFYALTCPPTLSKKVTGYADCKRRR